MTNSNHSNPFNIFSWSSGYTLLWLSLLLTFKVYNVVTEVENISL